MADILIRGMEMPTDEPLRIFLDANGQAFVDRGVYYDEFEAVKLPEHGDLIDKSELLENSKVNGMYPHWIDTMDVKRAPVIVPSNKEETE